MFATVKGDIHSIGKDICVSLLESQGFDVDDLGVDVPVERVARSRGRCGRGVPLGAHDDDAAGDGATRSRRCATRVDELPVFVGGAVVTARVGGGDRRGVLGGRAGLRQRRARGDRRDEASER